MNRDHTELTSADTMPAKKAKVTKALYVLLSEVSTGKYEDFRTWLAQTNCKSLDLNFGRSSVVYLSHIGNALQNTAVSQVNLRGDFINDSEAKDFGQTLKNTCVSLVNLSHSDIGDQGAKDFGQELKYTGVTQVDLSWNNIGAQGAKDFGQALTDTCVKQVDLSWNFIGDEGAKELLASLAGSKVQSLNLSGNKISKNVAPAIAELIDKTNLFELTLGFEHPAVTKALQKNGARLHFAAYEFARIHLLKAEEKQALIGNYHPALTKDSTSLVETKFAACALINVPTEVVYHIYSFLPFMNTKKMDKIFTTALERPAVFIESNESVDDELVLDLLSRACEIR